MVAHAFNPSTWEAEAGGFLSSRSAWSTKWVPVQPGLHRETLSGKQTNNKQTKNKKKKLEYNEITSTPELLTLAAFVSKDVLVGHHWKQIPIGQAKFICPSIGERQGQKMGMGG
jgi:hypothetical protein